MDERDTPQDAGQHGGSNTDERAAELARRAARLFKAGKPRIGRIIEQGKPRAERAGRHAIRFAQEHEDEIKLVGLRAARMRFRGPMGLVIDALSASGAGSGPRQHAANPCPACQAPTALNARFCNQCGTRLDIQE